MQIGQTDRLTTGVFFTAIVFGGLNAIMVRFTLVELPPFWGGLIRFLPASLILFVLVAALRLPMPRGRALLGPVLLGVLQMGGSFGLLYYGLQEVQPGMTQVLLALAPLLTLIMAIVHRQERFRWRALVGSLLALAGIAVVFGEQIALNVPILSLLAILLAAFFMAESVVILKGFPNTHPVTTNAIAMLAGSSVFALMVLVWGETPVLPVQTNTWLALVYLILIGSCLLFGLFLFVLKRWSASATAYGMVMMPFVTLAASAWLTGERITIVFLVGATLMLLGVYIGALSKSRIGPKISIPRRVSAGDD
jgi:drug/metabolite transporter (DMT)-like permease